MCTWLVKLTVFFENEGLLKVTGNHVYFKCSDILDMMQDGVIVTTDH